MRSTLFAGFAAIILLVAAAVPVSAKEGLEARFDAPIAMDTPAGTDLLVGVTVTVPDGEASRPVEGSPIYLRLTGRNGAATRAAGEPDGKPGHYVMRIEVPAGGAREAEVGLHGTTDLPILLVGDPFAFGGVTPATAQLAPPLPPAMTPLPRASVAAAAPGEVAPVEAAPVEAAPVEAAPGEVAPVEAAPGEAAAVDKAPVEAAPVEAAPVDVAAVEAAPVTDAGPGTDQPLDTAPDLPVLLAIGFVGLAGLLVILAIRRSRASATLRARPRTPGA